MEGKGFMKNYIKQITGQVLEGEEIDCQAARKLINIEEDKRELIEGILEGANLIRKKFVGDKADLCSIINGKSGRCSENCSYCAQSADHKTGIQEYGLLSYEKIREKAWEVQKDGVKRLSIVTSGKGISNEKELVDLVKIYQKLHQESTLKLCASHGIISHRQALSLKEAGVSCYHHNLETSRRYYSQICTTHTYDDRIRTIRNAQKAGLEVCCGGIIGLGEMPEDRVDMAFEIKKLGISSVPINILNPIKGTPLENLAILKPLEILKTMAVFRYIIPKAYIRYAGGRIALGEKQGEGFRGGVNAALVGDYLTTLGNRIQEDKELMREAGLEL
jgi:biotin synthase